MARILELCKTRGEVVTVPAEGAAPSETPARRRIGLDLLEAQQRRQAVYIRRMEVDLLGARRQIKDLLTVHARLLLAKYKLEERIKALEAELAEEREP